MIFNFCTDEVIKQESLVNSDKHLMSYNPVVKETDSW